MTSDAPPPDSLTVEAARSVDRVADEYSAACRAAARAGAPGPDLDPFLAGLPDGVAAAARRHILPAVPGYWLHGEIGRGGMGRVYRATEEATGREVAVKAVDGGEAARVDRLGPLLPVLIHPHVVPILGVVRHGGGVFLVMPLVEGGNLRAAIGRWSAHPDHCRPAEVPDRERRVAGLVEQLARAVAHLHDRAVLHRDLKPANVLLRGDRPLVCDLGLARPAEAGPDDPTGMGAVVGTVRYMAPEQLEGSPDLTVAVDVYALGAILYELLAGHPPFAGPGVSDDEVRRRRRGEALPPHPRGPNAQLPPDGDLAWLALECLHRDPARRPRARDLADQLQAFREGRPVRPRETWGQWRGRMLRWCSGGIKEPGYVPRWSRALRVEAVTCPLAHAGVFLLLSAHAPGWALWAAVLLGDTLLGWAVWVRARGRAGLRLTPMEVDVCHLWAAATAAEVLLFALHCPLFSPADPHDVVRFYPTWAVMRAVLFFVEGHLFWPRLRVVGLAYAAAAVALPWLGLYAALAYGALTGWWFLWLSFQVDRPRSGG